MNNEINRQEMKSAFEANPKFHLLHDYGDAFKLVQRAEITKALLDEVVGEGNVSCLAELLDKDEKTIRRDVAVANLNDQDKAAIARGKSITAALGEKKTEEVPAENIEEPLPATPGALRGTPEAHKAWHENFLRGMKEAAEERRKINKMTAWDLSSADHPSRKK